MKLIEIIKSFFFKKHHFAVYQGRNLLVYYNDSKLIPNSYKNSNYSIKRLVEL